MKRSKYQACRTSYTSLHWEDISLNESNATLLCDVSTGRPKPWILVRMFREMFDFIHGLSNPLRRFTAQLLKTKFIWHGITKNSKHWGHTGTSSQTSKVHQQRDSGVGTFHQPQHCFAHLHVAVVGPLPISYGQHYQFTVIDRSTHWHDVIPLEIAASTSCTCGLLSGWIVRFGIPEHITFDMATTFTSQLWTT
ncbi:uncharacterized protein [Palaemon carinicauda]|uniref:uncharacterized protein n=1 Tax=Palaemon carinicauda TaxID=392227 RepID=UPI0035B617C5